MAALELDEYIRELRRGTAMSTAYASRNISTSDLINYPNDL